MYAPAPIEDVLSSLGTGEGEAAPVLYIHGFYLDFDRGCIRATELQESAGLEGRFLWFSWPSDGSLFNYTHDEADLSWSVPDLTEIILTLVDRFGAGRVSLAGHSLGARGLVLAIQDIAARHPDVELGDVVLLAPDMDFDIFARLLPRIRPVVRSITIYVADTDQPLALSETVHGLPAAGPDRQRRDAPRRCRGDRSERSGGPQPHGASLPRLQPGGGRGHGPAAE